MNKTDQATPGGSKTAQDICPVEKAMRVIGGKWKGSIIYHLKDRPVRFNELTRMLGGATKKMVDQRLKEMEAEGMVKRTVINEKPIAVSYELTEFGYSTLDILLQIKNWSEQNQL